MQALNHYAFWNGIIDTVLIKLKIDDEFDSSY